MFWTLRVHQCVYVNWIPGVFITCFTRRLTSMLQPPSKNNHFYSRWRSLISTVESTQFLLNKEMKTRQFKKRRGGEGKRELFHSLCLSRKSWDNRNFFPRSHYLAIVSSFFYDLRGPSSSQLMDFLFFFLLLFLLHNLSCFYCILMISHKRLSGNGHRFGD